VIFINAMDEVVQQINIVRKFADDTQAGKDSCETEKDRGRATRGAKPAAVHLWYGITVAKYTELCTWATEILDMSSRRMDRSLM
jgi:hypothetical protein